MIRTRIASAVLAAFAVVLAGCTTNPVTGEQQLDLIGEAQEIAMGRQMYPAAVQSSLGALDDAPLQALVDRVGHDVAVVSHRPDMPWAFTAVNDPQVNAFALPGGKIAITRGMVSRLESVDGLAAVLGHEVGHVTARHVVAAYNRQLLAQLLVVGGGAVLEANDVKNRDLITFGAMVGAQLALAHYSREQERQSDELGLRYAVDAGYSPQGMIETQKVLLSLRDKEPGAVERMFASHPASRERLQTAREEVAALPADVRDRPVDRTDYRRAAADVIAVRPAWDDALQAQAMMQDKDFRGAEAKLAAAVRMDRSAGVLRTLHAVALANLDRDGAAVDEGAEGARLSPDVFFSRVVAGELLVEPQPRRALDELAAAEKILGGTAVVPFLQGRALERLGQRTEAARAYQETVRRDPQGQLGQQAAQRLQALGYASR